MTNEELLEEIIDEAVAADQAPSSDYAAYHDALCAAWKAEALRRMKPDVEAFHKQLAGDKFVLLVGGGKYQTFNRCRLENSKIDILSDRDDLRGLVAGGGVSRLTWLNSNMDLTEDEFNKAVDAADWA